MRRRSFIIFIGAETVCWPLAALAQSSSIPVVGLLGSTSFDELSQRSAPLRQSLNELGYVEGRNIAFEYRWAEGHYDRLPSLAAELVGDRVAVIVAGGPPASALAAKAATTTVPIVFMTGGDPVAHGLVASLNQPGGNITGVSLFNLALVPKQLELVKELLPEATVVAALVNPANPNTETERSELLSAAPAVRLELHVLRAGTELDFNPAFARAVERRASAIIVSYDAFFLSRRQQLVTLAARHSLPAIYHWREFAEAGGLVTYGTSVADAYRQVGVYVGKILRGAKPADLPVEQPTKFELVISLKTAKTLGLTIPPSVLARADEVIE